MGPVSRFGCDFVNVFKSPFYAMNEFKQPHSFFTDLGDFVIDEIPL